MNISYTGSLSVYGLALIKFTHFTMKFILHAVLAIIFLQQELCCGNNNVSIQHLVLCLNSFYQECWITAHDGVAPPMPFPEGKILFE